jgi:hypothetical protein
VGTLCGCIWSDKTGLCGGSGLIWTECSRSSTIRLFLGRNGLERMRKKRGMGWRPATFRDGQDFDCRPGGKGGFSGRQVVSHHRSRTKYIAVSMDFLFSQLATAILRTCHFLALAASSHGVPARTNGRPRCNGPYP